MSGEIGSTGELVGSTQSESVDYFTLGVSMLYSSIGILGKMVYAVVFFLPHLRETFMFPLALAVPIQALIYVVYAFGFIQFLSGRSGGMFQ